MGIGGKKAYIMILGIETNLYGNPQMVRVSISLLKILLKINYFFLIYILKIVNDLFLHTIFIVFF